MLNRTNQIDYRSLPSKVSHQLLLQIHNDWISFFKSVKDFKINPKKYKGCPRPPKYKHKTKGRNRLTYELGSISKKELKKGIIKLSGTDIKIEFINKDKKLKQVSIVKNNYSYTI
jgi:hypothetical protein